MSWFAVRKSHTGCGLFGGEKREYVDYVVVEADTVAEAVKLAVSRSSVSAIDDGMTLDVFQVFFESGERYTARYDSEPIADNHAATGARLIVAKES